MLIRELQSLGLDVRVLKDDGTEVELKENIEYGDLSIHSIIEGDRRYREENSYASQGFTTQEFKDGELVDSDSDIYGDSEFAGESGLDEEGLDEDDSVSYSDTSDNE